MLCMWTPTAVLGGQPAHVPLLNVDFQATVGIVMAPMRASAGYFHTAHPGEGAQGRLDRGTVSRGERECGWEAGRLGSLY